jgi:membrane protease subunit (stomatin/prohibitin family)
MGFFDNLKQQVGSQFIEVIQWLDESSDAMVYRFPVYNQEIKMGAKLTVREGQVALFVNEGKAADLFQPGTYELATQNVPILSTLRGWKYGFQSPFKAEVYFFNTRLFTDQKWGTPNPVMMRDLDFGMLRLRAFGSYTFRIADPKEFFNKVVGTHGLTTTEDISGQLRSSILSGFTDALGASKIPALDLAAKYDELSKLGRDKLGPEFASFGLELSKFLVENISLPEEVEAAIDARTKIGVFGDKMGAFTQLQAAEAIKVAAANPGGVAGVGVGIGAGVGIGQAMASAFSQQPAAAAPPPPLPAGTAARWSIAVDGKTTGPFTDQQVIELVTSGRIAADAQAWRPGASGWAPVATYAEFASVSMPPPPPPPPSK